MSKKKMLGQYFTKSDVWLQSQIIDFIKSSNCKIAYDPFAGEGDLIKVSKQYGISEVIGLDIDNNLDWEYNDSLIQIPHIENAIIITNPPYLAKQSATRRKIDLSNYFQYSKYDDIYLIALDRMLEAQKYVVAIIPESFINSSFTNKHLLHSITVLEDNPFLDTDAPVCVVCFDGIKKSFDKIKVYKNDGYVNHLQYIVDVRIRPFNHINMKFNDKSGWLGLRAVDSTDDNVKIQFDFKDSIKYDWQNRIKVSSRHFTLISIDIPQDKRHDFIDRLNDLISVLRVNSKDLILTPFMGNTKNGRRRRRMDFNLARAIIELVHTNMKLEKGNDLNIFNYIEGEINENK
jgi:hypothetical protein